jgi:hypothetical protein
MYEKEDYVWRCSDSLMFNTLMFLTCIFAGQVVDTMTSVKIIDRWHR